MDKSIVCGFFGPPCICVLTEREWLLVEVPYCDND